ncbi:MAG: RimK family alpha-L-glutamate ligase [Lachnospiraceae bacterium]
MENSQTNFVKMIYEICKEDNIAVQSYSSDWAFRLEKNGVFHFIQGYQFGLNSAVSAAICTDKSVASEVLAAAKIPTIPHHCFMAPSMFQYIGGNGYWSQMQQILERYGEIVCKDNGGTGGKMVFRVKNQRQLEEAASTIFQTCSAMAISPYRQIEKEYRIVILDGEIQVVFSKLRKHLTGDGVSTVRELYGRYILEETCPEQAVISKKDLNKIPQKGEQYLLQWKHNLGQGADAEILTKEKIDASLGTLAKNAAFALGVRFASVDVVQCEGAYQVLEVNSGVMMEYLSGINRDYYEIAKEIYRKAIHKMLNME